MHGQYYITVLFRNNNWMQGIEGEIDTVHASILHGGHVRPEEARPGSFTYYQSKNRAGRFKVKETPVGNSYGMYRVAEEDSYYWRIGHYLFPCFAMPPVPTLGQEARFLAYVPMDDEHTLEWSIGVREDDGLAVSARQAREYLGNGTGWYGRYVIGAELGQRFPDRPRGAAHDEELVRHLRRSPAGHGDDRGHGSHPRPHQRAPRHHGPDDYPHAPQAARRPLVPSLRTARRPPASRTPRTTTSAPARSSSPATLNGGRTPATFVSASR